MSRARAAGPGLFVFGKSRMTSFHHRIRQVICIILPIMYQRKLLKATFQNRNFITNGVCLGNPHVHIRKNFSSFFFFPHPLSCLHMQCLVGKVYYQTKKKKLSKPNELRPNSILFTGFLVLIRYLVCVKFCYSFIKQFVIMDKDQ